MMVKEKPLGAARPPELLYHLAEADNLDSILRHGLMSTERLLGLAGVTEPERALILRGHRKDGVRLPNGVLIRDQRPMPPAVLAKALDDGLAPSDWYALLNSFVFLWPDRKRMLRQREACGDRAQVLLTFDAPGLLERLGAEVFLSPFNSGNAMRKAARRGRDTLVPYAAWRRGGWPTGQRTRPPAEFLFRCVIPMRGPHLADVAEI
jgi:hypothetical protein